MHDQKLDIDRRNAALDEARTLIRELHDIADGGWGDAEVDRLLADYRYKILRKQREEEELAAGADEFGSETVAAEAEEAAIGSVSFACRRNGGASKTYSPNIPGSVRRK